jgi:hypothetical protein
VDIKDREISRLQSALSEWQRRVSELEGNEGLENLKGPALRGLLVLQQAGMDRTQNALKTLSKALGL